MPANARLDVESPEERQDRLARLLASQNEPSFPTFAGPPRTFHVGPPSELMSRLQAFLPEMAAANEQLANLSTADVDIENVGEDQEQYVEMDLGLGVFNARMKGDGASSSSSSDEESSSSSDDDDDSSDESSGEDNGVPAVLKIGQATGATKKNKGALIEMLDDKGEIKAAGEGKADGEPASSTTSE